MYKWGLLQESYAKIAMIVSLLYFQDQGQKNT
jgi:hypothetical protein